jgi:hypothetical protein
MLIRGGGDDPETREERTVDLLEEFRSRLRSIDELSAKAAEARQRAAEARARVEEARVKVRQAGTGAEDPPAKSRRRSK